MSDNNKQRMQWSVLLSPERLGSGKKPIEQARSPFHKDYDRIIFSQSFRVLNRKTQVHPLTQNDAVHTRLTHSLEVSCIGRSLGMLSAEKLRTLPSDISTYDVGAIIQAACLAHDIGNPPFGHAGEYAIREWFAQPDNQYLQGMLAANEWLDLLHFEGNASGLRTLTKLAYHPNEGGMRLTYATIGAFLKYPWGSDYMQRARTKKFGCYQTEIDLLEKIGQHLQLIPLGNQAYCRHPLVYLLEAADDICYALIDLEDGLLLGMLAYEKVEPILLQLIGDYGTPSELTRDTPIEQKLAALRGRAMKRLVDTVSDAFANNEELLLTGTMQGSLLSYCPPDIADGIAKAKSLARDCIFSHPNKARLELFAGASLHHLLDAFIPLTAHKHKKLGFREERIMLILKHHGAQFDGNVYHNIMQVLDMITSLSDHQAYAMSQELSGQKMALIP